MPTSPSSPLDPRRLTEALDAVAEVNGEWIEALRDHANAGNPDFPMSGTLRPLFAALTPAQCRERGRCGVLLIDGAFTDAPRWQRILDRADTVGEEASVGENSVAHEHAAPQCWLPHKHAIVLAHSALIVIWHVVHTCPATAGVLLGMSEPVAQIYARLNLSDLSRLARTHPGGFRPRWSDRPDLWAGILQSNSDESRTSAVLQCLKLSATGSSRLLSTVSRDV